MATLQSPTWVTVTMQVLHNLYCFKHQRMESSEMVQSMQQQRNLGKITGKAMPQRGLLESVSGFQLFLTVLLIFAAVGQLFSDTQKLGNGTLLLGRRKHFTFHAMSLNFFELTARSLSKTRLLAENMNTMIRDMMPEWRSQWRPPMELNFLFKLRMATLLVWRYVLDERRSEVEKWGEETDAAKSEFRPGINVFCTVGWWTRRGKYSFGQVCATMKNIVQTW